MRQDLRMSTQLVMTPQLQQAIKLLQLSRSGLVDLVRSELMENPLLEEAHEIGTSAEEPVSPVELQDAVDAPQQEAGWRSRSSAPRGQGRRGPEGGRRLGGLRRLDGVHAALGSARDAHEQRRRGGPPRSRRP